MNLIILVDSFQPEIFCNSLRSLCQRRNWKTLFSSRMLRLVLVKNKYAPFNWRQMPWNEVIRTPAFQIPASIFSCVFLYFTWANVVTKASLQSTLVLSEPFSELIHASFLSMFKKKSTNRMQATNPSTQKQKKEMHWGQTLQ